MTPDPHMVTDRGPQRRLGRARASTARPRRADNDETRTCSVFGIVAASSYGPPPGCRPASGRPIRQMVRRRRGLTCDVLVHRVLGLELVVGKLPESHRRTRRGVRGGVFGIEQEVLRVVRFVPEARPSPTRWRPCANKTSPILTASNNNHHHPDATTLTSDSTDNVATPAPHRQRASRSTAGDLRKRASDRGDDGHRLVARDRRSSGDVLGAEADLHRPVHHFSLTISLSHSAAVLSPSPGMCHRCPRPACTGSCDLPGR